MANFRVCVAVSISLLVISELHVILILGKIKIIRESNKNIIISLHTFKWSFCLKIKHTKDAALKSPRFVNSAFAQQEFHRALSRPLLIRERYMKTLAFSTKMPNFSCCFCSSFRVISLKGDKSIPTKSKHVSLHP